MKFISSRSSVLCALVTTTCYTASLWLVIIDSSREYRWYTFGIWGFALICWFGCLRGLNAKPETQIRNNKFKALDLVLLAGISALAIITRFIFLERYPYPSVGDCLRDGGLQPMLIISGVRKDIFGWGNFGSHGLIIPTISSVFFLIFGHSNLSFRVPAALLSILGILLCYIVGKAYHSRACGFWAALILACMPINLFYGRLYINGSCSVVWMLLILAGMLRFFRQRTFLLYALLGTGFGLALGFHAALKAALFSSLALILVVSILDVTQKRITLRTMVFRVGIFLVATLIGIGPRLPYSGLSSLLHLRRIPLAQQFSQSATPVGEEFSLNTLGTRYVSSLAVFTTQGTGANLFKVSEPLLNPVVAAFFLIGFASPIFLRQKSTPHWYLNFLVLLLPFTNSAMTDGLNLDNRMTTMFPLSAILAGIGISQVSNVVNRLGGKSHLLISLCSLVLLSYLLWQGPWRFFDQQLAGYTRRSDQQSEMFQDYALAHLIEDIRSFRSQGKWNHSSLCLGGAPRMLRFLEFQHVREQLDYFLPEIKYLTVPAPEGTSEKYLLVADSCKELENHTQFREIKPCSDAHKFTCPPDSSDFSLKLDPKLFR